MSQGSQENEQENEEKSDEYLEPVNSLAENDFTPEIYPEQAESEIIQKFELDEQTKSNFDVEIETAFTFSPEKSSDKVSSSKTTESTLTYQATMDGTLCNEEIEEFKFEYKSPRQTLVPAEFEASDLKFPSDQAPDMIPNGVNNEWIQKTTSLIEFPAASRNTGLFWENVMEMFESG